MPLIQWYINGTIVIHYGMQWYRGGRGGGGGVGVHHLLHMMCRRGCGLGFQSKLRITGVGSSRNHPLQLVKSEC
jgi:hypothetical protein